MVLVQEMRHWLELGPGLYLGLFLLVVCPPSPDLALVLIKEESDLGQWRVGLAWTLNLTREDDEPEFMQKRNKT